MNTLVKYLGIKLSVASSCNEDAEIIISDVQLLDADENILPILSDDVVSWIENQINTNWDKITQEHNDFLAS